MQRLHDSVAKLSELPIGEVIKMQSRQSSQIQKLESQLQFFITQLCTCEQKLLQLKSEQNGKINGLHQNVSETIESMHQTTDETVEYMNQLYKWIDELYENIKSARQELTDSKNRLDDHTKLVEILCDGSEDVYVPPKISKDTRAMVMGMYA